MSDKYSEIKIEKKCELEQGNWNEYNEKLWKPNNV